MRSNRQFGEVIILNLGTADSMRMSHIRECALMSKSLKSHNTHEILSSAQIQTTSTGLLQFLDLSTDALMTVNQAGVIVMVNRTC